MKFMYTIPWFGTNHKKAVHTKLKKTNSESNCINISFWTNNLHTFEIFPQNMNEN